MEPLFVDNDFGRGFDSRRLHQISVVRQRSPMRI